MRTSALGQLCLVVLISICSGGCLYLAAGAAGVGAAAGTYAYVRGQLEVAYPAGYERTWAATLDSLNELELGVESADKDAFGGEIKAKRADGTSVKIAVAPVTSNSTSVKIRVGTFGNRTISETIANKIENKLK